MVRILSNNGLAVCLRDSAEFSIIGIVRQQKPTGDTCLTSHYSSTLFLQETSFKRPQPSTVNYMTYNVQKKK